jgi:predicted nucleotidyltransferase
MKPSEALHRHRDAILAIARRHHAERVRVFGSVGRGEDREGSDLDLLVDFDGEASLFDAFALQEELEDLLGQRVELATPAGLHGLVRARVLQEARPL